MPVFATLTLVNNLLGLAPGPIVTGFIADHIGLLGALRLIPLVAILATLAFVTGMLNYQQGLRRLSATAAGIGE